MSYATLFFTVLIGAPLLVFTLALTGPRMRLGSAVVIVAVLAVLLGGGDAHAAALIGGLR